MEIIQFTVFTGLCIGLLATILINKHQNLNWQKAQDVMLNEHARQTVELEEKHAQEIEQLNQSFEDELAEMEASCQELEQYDQNKYNQLNEAFMNLQIKHDIVCSRNRKLRPGFDVQAVTKAVNKAKGVHVS